jgi:hypothetical protein
MRVVHSHHRAQRGCELRSDAADRAILKGDPNVIRRITPTLMLCKQHVHEAGCIASRSPHLKKDEVLFEARS